MSRDKYTDMLLICVDCGEDFKWTASEQSYYQSHQLSQVKRCKPCRKAKRQEFADRWPRNPAA